MSLGLCCQYLEPQTKRNGSIVYSNTVGEKTLQLGRFRNQDYTNDKVKETYMHNITSHYALVPKLVRDGIQSFRLSSGLLPLWDLTKHIFEQDHDIVNALQHLGGLFISANIRVTTHPGQFTVISSDNPNVVKNSIAELAMHGWVFDTMGLPRSAVSAINIHGGKSDRASNIISVYRNLPDSVRSRLTLENDERCYGVDNLLAIHEHTGIPVVFDSHHFSFNDDKLSFEEAYALTKQTWGDIKPLQHVSNTEPGMESATFNLRRAHSQFLHYIPEQQLQDMISNVIDVDVEAKQKNLAISKMKIDFNIPA